jgi:peptide/nickel transport system substrate-binding protein
MGRGGSGSKGLRSGVLAALLALLALAGCGGGGSSSGGDSGSTSGGGTPQRGGVLTIDFGEEAKGLDPLANFTYTEINIMTQINETLFKTNADGKIEPFLAKSYEKSPDEKKWTLHLQEGVTFSDGKPMTSKDVVFSLEGVRKSALWESFFATVTSIRATSPTTVVIDSSQPMPALPAELSLFAAGIVPDDFGGVSEKEFGQHPIGTGPFEVGTWNRGQQLTLLRNPHYWGPEKALLDEIVVRATPDDESRLAQLRSGQIDVAYNPPWNQITELENTAGIKLGKYALGLTDYLIVNSQKPLFQDPKVREAINIGINRDSIVKTAFSDQAPAAGSWFPLSLPYADAGIKPARQDVAKARQLLAEGVKATGEQPEFTILFGSGEAFYGTIAQVAQQNLEEVGFKVTLKPLDQAAATELLENGEYDVSILSIYSTIPDPTELATFYVGTGALWSGADTDQINQLGEEGLSEVDPDKRRAIYYEIQEIIDSEHFIVTTNDRPWVYALQEDVEGFSVGATGTPWLNEVGFAG